MLFIPYTPTVFLFLFNFVNITIEGYYLGLLAAIIQQRSWINEIRPIKIHLGPTTHPGDLYFQGHSSMQNS